MLGLWWTQTSPFGVKAREKSFNKDMMPLWLPIFWVERKASAES